MSKGDDFYTPMERVGLSGYCFICAAPLKWVACGSCCHRNVCSTCVCLRRLICDDWTCFMCKNYMKVTMLLNMAGRCLMQNAMLFFRNQPALSIGGVTIL